MCSISGIFSVRARNVRDTMDAQEIRSAVESMNAALRHRGPDDQGIADIGSPNHGSESSNGDRLCLGNTRLAIIDRSMAGHQPMHDPETGNWITYNGETYNFRQLRSEIGDEFGPWRSQTDTEVVLRAYRKWGVNAFKKMRGMFAVAIWDQKRRELILSRDVFGIKPLYYYLAKWSRFLVFASEVRALLASNLVPRSLNNFGLESFLEYGSVQAPLTIIDGVCSLMPGEVLRISVSASSNLQLESRINGLEARKRSSSPSKYSEAVAFLRQSLQESVRLHLVSDVPLGVFLSGGIDSSAILALISRVSREKPKTFSVIFDEEEFSERNYSRLVAKQFNAEHCEVHLDEKRLLDILPSAIASVDQPTIDGLNTYVVSKAVKEAGITVSVSGLGGDELFGGYPTFRRTIKLQGLGRFTHAALRRVSEMDRIFANGSTRRKKFQQFARSDGDPVEVYRISRQLFDQSEVSRIIPRSRIASNQKSLEFKDDKDAVNTISRLELENYMANTLLRDTDSMSMAHSLEVRVPFIDSEVVQYVLSLPGDWKMNGGKVQKPLLAAAISDLLPAAFFARPKMGFTLPLEKWMRSRLRDEITSKFDDPEPLSRTPLEQPEVRGIWQSFLHKPKSTGWAQPWSLYILANWCSINL